MAYAVLFLGLTLALVGTFGTLFKWGPSTKAWRADEVAAAQSNANYYTRALWFPAFAGAGWLLAGDGMDANWTRAVWGLLAAIQVLNFRTTQRRQHDWEYRVDYWIESTLQREIDRATRRAEVEAAMVEFAARMQKLIPHIINPN